MAANVSTSALCCLNLQQSLDAISGALAPANIMIQPDFLTAVMSPANTTGFEKVEVIKGKGLPQTGVNARPRVQIEYEKPQCEVPTSTILGLCGDQAAAGDSKGYLDITIDGKLALGGKFSKTDFDALCETPQERLAKRVTKTARNIQRQMSAALATNFYNGVGNYSNGQDSATNTKTIPLLNGAGYANPAAFSLVRSEFRKMYASGSPIVVGGDILSLRKDTQMVAGIGANGVGAVVGSQDSGINTFVDFDIDPTINTAAGTSGLSYGLSWAPGAVQLLEWFRNEGEFETLDRDDYTETTIVVDGIKYDFTLNYDKCTHTWDYELSKYFDLFKMPDAVLSDCFDFNYCLAWQFTCGDFDCTDYFPPVAP